jgi:hypothetical protein
VNDWAKSDTRWFVFDQGPGLLTWKDPRPARTAWREHFHACTDCFEEDIPRMLKRSRCPEGERLEGIAAAERGYMEAMDGGVIEYGGPK